MANLDEINKMKLTSKKPFGKNNSKKETVDEEGDVKKISIKFEPSKKGRQSLREDERKDKYGNKKIIKITNIKKAIKNKRANNPEKSESAEFKNLDDENNDKDCQNNCEQENSSTFKDDNIDPCNDNNEFHQEENESHSDNSDADHPDDNSDVDPNDNIDDESPKDNEIVDAPQDDISKDPPQNDFSFVPHNVNNFCLTRFNSSSENNMFFGDQKNNKNSSINIKKSKECNSRYNEYTTEDNETEYNKYIVENYMTNFN